jgi:hypothetical protein
MDYSKWGDTNDAGFGCPPKSTDSPLNDDMRRDLDNAAKASRLHDAANKLADRSRK